MAEETAETKSVPQQKPQQPSFFEANKQLILLGITFAFFILSYFFKFTKTEGGVIFLAIAIGTFIIFMIMSFRPEAIRFGNEDYVKDPEFYFLWFKRHYHELIDVRFAMSFMWLGQFMFQPAREPEFIFLELKDKINLKPYVATIRVSRDAPTLRGLFAGSWDDFMRYRIYRMRMAGFFPTTGSTITYVGADGKPITVPSEAINILNERGLI